MTLLDADKFSNVFRLRPGIMFVTKSSIKIVYTSFSMLLCYNLVKYLTPVLVTGLWSSFAPHRRCYSAETQLFYTWLAAWRSGNGVGRINKVTLRRARLVLGWVTCPGSTPAGGTLFRYVNSHPGRLSLSSFRGR